MHIAFLCDETTKYSDANLEICTRLAREFRSRGNRVSILGNCEGRDAPLEEEVDGIVFYRFYYPINRITHQIWESYNRDHCLRRLTANFLRHPIIACVNIVRVFLGYNLIDWKYMSLLKKVNKINTVDLVVASGGAFYPIHALAKCRIHCHKVGYMLDPYWKNHFSGGPRAKKEELFAWRRLDHMVIPKLLETDYKDAAFSDYRHKVTTAEFPGIMEGKLAETEPVFDRQKKNLLFAGNFYEQIRSPRYLLELMEELPEDFCLNIMGGIYGSFDDEIKVRMERLSREKKLKLHGCVPAVCARAAMGQADVLVNIGNTVENQLPSKIFEYFSTGKPVIHIQKIQNCPCLPYMERYGNALILSETDPISDNAEKVRQFSIRGTELLFEVVKSRFEDCTIPHVADLFLNLIGE